MFPHSQEGSTMDACVFSFRHGRKQVKVSSYKLNENKKYGSFFLVFMPTLMLTAPFPSAAVVLGCFGYINTETNRVFGALGQNHHYFFFRFFW